MYKNVYSCIDMIYVYYDIIYMHMYSYSKEPLY